MDKIAPPTPKAPGRTAPNRTTRVVCNAIFPTESSGITLRIAAADANEAAAPPNNIVGGVLRAVPANGNNAGANSIPFAISGRALSLDASSTPNRSNSSAKTNRGLAVDSLTPDRSSFDNNPNWEV